MEDSVLTGFDSVVEIGGVGVVSAFLAFSSFCSVLFSTKIFYIAKNNEKRKKRKTKKNNKQTKITKNKTT